MAESIVKDSVLAPSPWSSLGPLILAFHWTHVSCFSFSRCITLSETLVVEPDWTLTGKDTCSLCCWCSVSQSCPTLWPHGLQHARIPCPSPSPRACSNSCPLNQWSHSNHLVLCHPLFLLPSIFPSIRISPNESTLHISWPKYWSFSFSISMFIEVNMISGVPLSEVSRGFFSYSCVSGVRLEEVNA